MAAAVASAAAQSLSGSFRDLDLQDAPPRAYPAGDRCRCSCPLGASVPALASAPPQHHGAETSTPIKHLVVLYQENVSFDHYFAHVPRGGEPGWRAAVHGRAGTRRVSGLNASLLAPNNPNSVQPFRLSRAQAQTCDQDHSYTAEQKAFDSGLMDRFVETVGRGTASCADYGKGKGLVMGYYDGNTVTGLWNYAQHFAMSDNSYSTTFGPSTPGALNLVSGQTHGFSADGEAVPATSGTVIGDPQPTRRRLRQPGQQHLDRPENKNIGDLLNAKHVSWGWFQGGFADCAATHTNVGGVVSKDYIPHHEPFQYYASTANPKHTPPASVAEIGHDGAGNHQYDLTDFWSAVDAGSMPAVSFLKAAAYQDGHAGYSSPLDEQRFLVETINRLQKTPEWKNTAVVIAYDDSDGWYDHKMGPIVNQSTDPAHDALTADGTCGTQPGTGLRRLPGPLRLRPAAAAAGRLSLRERNFVDHTVTDQTSILRFIEDNWRTGQIGNHSFDEKAGRLANMFTFGDG